MKKHGNMSYPLEVMSERRVRGWKASEVVQ